VSGCTLRAAPGANALPGGYDDATLLSHEADNLTNRTRI